MAISDRSGLSDQVWQYVFTSTGGEDQLVLGWPSLVNHSVDGKPNVSITFTQQSGHMSSRVEALEDIAPGTELRHAYPDIKEYYARGIITELK